MASASSLTPECRDGIIWIGSTVADSVLLPRSFGGKVCLFCFVRSKEKSSTASERSHVGAQVVEVSSSEDLQHRDAHGVSGWNMFTASGGADRGACLQFGCQKLAQLAHCGPFCLRVWRGGGVQGRETSAARFVKRLWQLTKRLNLELASNKQLNPSAPSSESLCVSSSCPDNGARKRLCAGLAPKQRP